MLSNVPATNSLDATVKEYLHDTLGIVAQLRPWVGAGKLPYFLQEAFEVRELTLLDHPILLAVDRQPNKPALANIRAQLEKLRALSGHAVVYVTRALASYERKRLIEQKVSFIVPGNQLYLPDLGIDLRQYFRQRSRLPDTALSPATQAMLITILLRKHWQDDCQPAEVVAALGYTPMTLSRAVKELIAAGIATLHNDRRTRRLRMIRSGAQAWEHAKPMLRSPVKRSVWVHLDAELQPPHVLFAGLSALARYSLLTEPQWPIYALSPAQWKAATQAGVEILVEPLPDSCEWQLWSYNPALVADSATVDPLSLALSLQDDADERVQLALGELKEGFPW
jgi:DNA-binding MarR family transcriptional regulator